VSTAFLKVLEGTSVTPEEAVFLIVWEFAVKPGKESEFEAAYGPQGVWVRFFRRGKGYRTTKLLRDGHGSGTYCTLDFWDSRAAYEQFKQVHAQEYAVIDSQCEGLAERETLIGHYEGVAPVSGPDCG
jgi:heme-degrading monooxygenase HmoA